MNSILATGIKYNFSCLRRGRNIWSLAGLCLISLRNHLCPLPPPVTLLSGSVDTAAAHMPL